MDYTYTQTPIDENIRLQTLFGLNVLDTPANQELDSLVKVAALACKVTSAFVSLGDSDRQWVKAWFGMDATEASRAISFCGHAILGDGLFEVEDASIDERFLDNPLVAREGGIRFYAGAPLMLRSGARVGTLCVISDVPRRLDDARREILISLAKAAASLLESARDEQVNEQLGRQTELAKKDQGTLIDAIFEGVVHIKADGHILWCNEQACELLGVDSAAMTNKAHIAKVNQCIRPDMTEWPHEDHPSTLALRKGIEIKDVVMGIRKPNGQVTWVAINAKPLYDGTMTTPSSVVLSFNDITHRKAIGDKLISNEHLLHTITHSMPNMIAYWDSSLRCRFANSAYKDWFGKTDDELKRMELRELLGAEVYAFNQHRIEGVLSGIPQRFERTMARVDGSIGHTIAEYVPDRVGDRVVGFIAVVTDVTDLKLAHLELERVNRDLETRTLEAQGALQTKSQFLANMSHEIRTPMNAIIGMMKLMGTTQMSRQQADYHAKTEVAAKALLGLINDILDFSKLDAGKMDLDPKAFSINRLMRELAVFLSASIGMKPIEVLYDIDAAIPQALIGDSMRISQVLMNLAGNAVKFTMTGEVVISLKAEPASGSGSRRVTFSVRDTGIGIDAENQAKIFTSFSQAEASTSRRFGGTGLGLSISQRLVSLMGGQIRLESALGVGSEFSFVLDLQEVRLEDLSEDEINELGIEQGPVPSGVPNRILIIDDNHMSCDLLSRMMEPFGWVVDVAHSGTEGLEMIVERAQAGSSPYDCIYIDWRMPGMDGWQTLQHLDGMGGLMKQARPRIVMMSSNDRDSLLQRTDREQELVNALLVKPITASMLLDASLRNPSDSESIKRAGKSSHRRLAGMRVLVVEDNAINQQVAEELLAFEGAHISIAGDGRQGVNAVAAAKVQFDVVLMDVQMPVMDGFVATRTIREQLQLPSLPIIGLTANALDSDRAACISAGMNAHVGKPFDMDQLVDTMLAVSGFQSAGDAGPSEVPESVARFVAARRDDAVQLPADTADLSLSRALSRMGGMQKLYVRSALKFQKALSTLRQDILACIERGDDASVRMHAHTVKGTAGTLGLDRLSAKLADIEVSVKDDPAMTGLADQVGADLSPLILKAQGILDETVAQMTAGASRVKTEESSSVPRISAAVREVVASMVPLLKDGDLAAMEVFAGIAGDIGGAEDADLLRLEAAMSDLDLDLALQACEAILQQAHTHES